MYKIVPKTLSQVRERDKVRERGRSGKRKDSDSDVQVYSPVANNNT